MRIKKNDTVLIMTGRDKGRRGKVLEILDNRQRLVVEGINQVKRHVKAGRHQKAPQGGIIEVSAPIHVSNVRPVCIKCERPTQIGIRKLEDGEKRRYCKQCNESLDK